MLIRVSQPSAKLLKHLQRNLRVSEQQGLEGVRREAEKSRRLSRNDIGRSRLVLEYGFGRPMQAVEVDVTQKHENMTEEQLKTRIRELHKQLPADYFD